MEERDFKRGDAGALEKFSFVPLCLIFILSFFYSLPSTANTLQVCPSCPLSTIRQAIDQAQAGDTIEVQGGVYSEGSLSIDKSIRLRGLHRPIIDGLRQGHVFYIRADQVLIEGFTIRNSGMSSVSEFAGIRMEEGKECKIRNNIFENNTYSIYLAKMENCAVENNQITGNAKNEVSGGNGLHLWYSKNITIRGNQFRKHRDGIYLEFTTDSLIEENLSEQNIRYGMHFMYCHRGRYLQNTFRENQTGVAVMYSRKIEMFQNQFEKSWGKSSYGILLKDISDSKIEQNLFYANTVGIFADEVNRDFFIQNTFKNNGWGVNILGSSAENIFRENNFISNYFDVATNSRESFNQFSENYWGNYQGYDLNRDGYGDVPHRPMKIFGLWVSKYPELVVLLESPTLQFLEVAEKIFPILTPKTMQDERPRMKPVVLAPSPRGEGRGEGRVFNLSIKLYQSALSPHPPYGHLLPEEKEI